MEIDRGRVIDGMTTIWGERIGLRPFEDILTDSEIAHVHHWSTDELVLRWSGGAPSELTFTEFRDRLRSEQPNPIDNRRAFFIFTKGGELIGRIGIFAIDPDKGEGELGIVIGEPSAWHNGYGRAAVTLLLQHLFETTPLERINLYTFSDNYRAQQCFAACGFRTFGTARRFSPDIGEFDGIEMEVTRREFLARERSRNSIQISVKPNEQ